MHEQENEQLMLFREAGFTVSSHTLGCYCLIGYRGDTFEKAEKRLIQTIKAGFTPYAMLYRDKRGEVDQEWRRFQRTWVRPEIIYSKINGCNTNEKGAQE